MHADDARGDVELLRYVVHLGSAASLLEFVRQLISPGRVGMLARVVVLRALARWGEEQLEGGPSPYEGSPAWSFPAPSPITVAACAVIAAVATDRTEDFAPVMDDAESGPPAAAANSEVTRIMQQVGTLERWIEALVTGRQLSMASLAQCLGHAARRGPEFAPQLHSIAAAAFWRGLHDEQQQHSQIRNLGLGREHGDWAGQVLDYARGVYVVDGSPSSAAMGMPLLMHGLALCVAALPGAVQTGAREALARALQQRQPDVDAAVAAALDGTPIHASFTILHTTGTLYSGMAESRRKSSMRSRRVTEALALALEGGGSTACAERAGRTPPWLTCLSRLACARR